MAQVAITLEMDVQGPGQIVAILAILSVRCQANILHSYGSGIGAHPKLRNGLVGLLLTKWMVVQCFPFGPVVSDKSVNVLSRPVMRIFQAAGSNSRPHDLEFGSGDFRRHTLPFDAAESRTNRVSSRRQIVGQPPADMRHLVDIVKLRAGRIRRYF